MRKQKIENSIIEILFTIVIVADVIIQHSLNSLLINMVIFAAFLLVKFYYDKKEKQL